ncbi:hypothetical protein Tco_0106455, partial [Tanacetum coccineum]
EDKTPWQSHEDPLADGTRTKNQGLRSKIKKTLRGLKAEIEGLENTLIHLTEEAQVQDLEPSHSSINSGH